MVYFLFFMKPYIGITGFKFVEEVLRISSAADKLGLGNDKEYTLMLGFLTADRDSKIFFDGDYR